MGEGAVACSGGLVEFFPPFDSFMLALEGFLVFGSPIVGLLILTVFIYILPGDFVLDLKLEAPIAASFSFFSLFELSVKTMFGAIFSNFCFY